MKIITRFLKPHSRKCWFATGQSKEHPWIFDTYQGMKHESRSVDGRRRMKSGGYRWIPFRCNDPNCPATGVVRLDSIEFAIPRD